MFKFLKEKLNSVVKKFSSDVEEESEKVEVTKETEILKEESSSIKQTKQPSDKDAQRAKQNEEEKQIKSDEKTQEQKEKTKPNISEKSKLKESEKSDKKEKKQGKKESETKETLEIAPEEKKEKQGIFSKIFGHKKSKEEIIDDKKHVIDIKKEDVLSADFGVDDESPKDFYDESQMHTATKEIVKEFKEEDEFETSEIKQYWIEDERPDAKSELKNDDIESDEKPREKSEDEISIKKETQSIAESRKVENAKIPDEKPQEKTDKTEETLEDVISLKSEDEIPKEKKGFFTKITETFTKINLSEDKFEELFWDLEIMLLENNVAVEVIHKIKQDLKVELMSSKVSRRNVDEIIKDSLRRSIEEILDIKGFELDDKIKAKKPYIIAVVGVNGSGKTTTIAKLCHMLKKNGHSVVLAAADTFRAAAIQQLEYHATKLDIKLIKHDYNSDPAAVAFDAIKHAQAKNLDVVIIDTAGRLHSNDNLMNELKKLIKVNKPDLKLFVGESITGNDCVEQAKVYDEIIGIDAIILSKADVDEKGGAALSIAYVTKKPVLFIGTGQTYDDLKNFNKKEILEGLGF
jgi:fused signal recognition particle receptor